MKKSLLAISVSIILLNMSSGIAYAEGNISAGKAKSASCAGCHGEKGNSLMPLFPKLAGQNEGYLVQQMQAFKKGKRLNAVMTSMVAGLSDQDIEDIAAYYQAQKITENKLPPIELDDDEDDELSEEQKAEAKKNAQAKQSELLALGYDVYRNGDLVNEVSACIACHGPYGEGNEPAAFPALRGQHADYIMKTLTDFKNDARTTNPENMMNMIAKKMTKDEIKALAYYISTMK